MSATEPFHPFSASREKRVTRAPLRGAGLALCGALACASPSAAGTPDGEQLRAALKAACNAPVEEVQSAVLAALGGGIVLSDTALDAPPELDATRRVILRRDGSRVRVDLHRSARGLRQAILELRERGPHGMRPAWWVVADGRCEVRVARRLEYRDGGAASGLQVLGPSLTVVTARLELDAAVPPGAPAAGVPVAMVDSGVNYTLPAIASRLARDARGALLGYDFWDRDPRPFDLHPVRSPFLPLRHGTATASVLLDDAPVALVAPYRYPRPDMSRMQALIEHAAAAGIRIVNLSLGGAQRDEWDAFERAARAHPHMLFIASAGNDGRDIDAAPVFPAALELDNLITVTSSDASGVPARGSNWGRHSVDLMIPAEGLVATGFDGYARFASGSSYAAARVSALAACLLAENPQWTALQLKRALFDRALRPAHPSLAYVAVGTLPEPTLAARGACPREPGAPLRLGRLRLDESRLSASSRAPAASHAIPVLTLLWVRNAGWSLEQLLDATTEAAGILAQCGVRVDQAHIELLELPRRQRYYDTATATALMRSISPSRPAAWFVRDTLQQIAFDAEAIGRSNGRSRPELVGTLWLTAHLRDVGVALAHELFHVLADTGGHVPERDNLMHGDTRPDATRLEAWQCERLRRVGTALGWLRAIEP